jgi:hypothetical protein
LLGGAFAVCAAPCIGVVLGSVLVLASDSRTVVRGAVLLAIYSAGLGLGFVLIGVAFAQAMNAFRWLRDQYDALRIGGGVTLVALGLRSLPALYAGVLVAGVGVGAVFSAFVRAVAPLAPPDRRGGLLAAIYILTYASFSVPAVVAGAGVSAFGLEATTYAYGAAVIVLAVLTTIAVARRLRRQPVVVTAARSAE